MDLYVLISLFSSIKKLTDKNVSISDKHGVHKRKSVDDWIIFVRNKKAFQ